MSSFFLSVAGFIVAIGILVTVHEFGHFWVARKLGVKVLRFSVGFGKPIISWRGNNGPTTAKSGDAQEQDQSRDNTEYVIAAIPLGGYVKMLDEREGDVPERELHRAFNRQSLPVRSAIVVAPPSGDVGQALDGIGCERERLKLGHGRNRLVEKSFRGIDVSLGEKDSSPDRQREGSMPSVR